MKWLLKIWIVIFPFLSCSALMGYKNCCYEIGPTWDQVTSVIYSLEVELSIIEEKNKSILKFKNHSDVQFFEYSGEKWVTITWYCNIYNYKPKRYVNIEVRATPYGWSINNIYDSNGICPE